MRKTFCLVISLVLGTMAANSLAQEASPLFAPPKIDWNSIGKIVADTNADAYSKKATPVVKTTESKRARLAVEEFLKKGNRGARKSKIDGVWKSAPGVYYVFDGGRSAQLLFLDIMSNEGPEGPPLVLDSRFQLTETSINFDPDEGDTRNVPYVLSRNKDRERVLRLNLNGNKWTDWIKQGNKVDQLPR